MQLLKTSFCFLILLFLSIFPSCLSFRILIYSPRMIPSHVAFVADIANLLGRKGHKVIVVDSVLRSDIGNKLDTNYIEKIIEVATAENVEKSVSKSEIPLTFWSMRNEPEEQKEVMEQLGRLFLEQCKHLVLETNVLRELESMQFDFGMHEVFDVCGLGIFERLKIRRSVILSSAGMRDIVNEALGILGPLQQSSILSDYGNHVPLLETRRNLKFHSAWRNFFKVQSQELEPLFNVDGCFEQLLRYSNLMFVNTHELADSHRPWSRRVHEIGGISFKKSKKLKEEYTEMFEKFSSVVLITFGTTTPSFLMPSECKLTLKKVLETFPEVLFIWKYEKEDNFTKSFQKKNVLFRKYVPQVDLLESGRISLFITHGGQNSLLESFHANVRSLVIPLFGDQHRNARISEENGLVDVLEKRYLSNEERVEAAVKRGLSGDKPLEAKLRRVSMNLRDARQSAERLLIASIEATYAFTSSDSHPPPNFECFPEFYNSDVILLILDTLIFVSLVLVLKKLLFV